MTNKAIELKPDLIYAQVNLGGIYKDLGKLDQALASTLKSLELKPGNPDAHMNLGGIYKDLGNLDQALKSLSEASKSEKNRRKALMAFAEICYYNRFYNKGIDAISELNNRSAQNLLLSLHLCLDEKLKFNQCAHNLISKQWLDERGVAAIDHANILYHQELENGLSTSTLDSILTQTINKEEFPDALMEEILMDLSNETFQTRQQGHLTNGQQTSGNILDIHKNAYKELKKLLIQKIDAYNQSSNGNTEKDFKSNWEKNMYLLRGWAIIMSEGGNLKSHNHEKGWLTGTFYLQMPERNLNQEEGAIEFSHKGPNYPEGASTFPTRIIQPESRDLNIFPSSLFHKTLPFKGEKQRICVAFDVQRNENHWQE